MSSIDLLDYGLLEAQFLQHDMAAFADCLSARLASGLSLERYGDIPRWRQALDQLPPLSPSSFDLSAAAVRVGEAADCDAAQRQQLTDALKGLHPWRKGPFELFGVAVDTEWRSDIKWQRLADTIAPLAGRKVLDVGCGSGYHAWRMAGAGAEFVLGIDPTPLFVMQYWALQRYLQNPAVWVLPMPLETVPAKLAAFDTVFSMGVLYHRRSPFDHLQALRETLRPGGQLVLETLVIEGGEGEVLVPEGRYSKMGNVWFIPSVATLCGWLKKMRFENIAVVDVSTTTVEEQRSTEWMQFHSLADFLADDDRSKTVEGYPAPRRAVMTATA